jgi:ABC-type branched-subunit amino acid transport system permease subunit
VKEYSDLVYALLLLGALMFMPKGLAGWIKAKISNVHAGRGEP